MTQNIIHLPFVSIDFLKMPAENALGNYVMDTFPDFVFNVHIPHEFLEKNEAPIWLRFNYRQDLSNVTGENKEIYIDMIENAVNYYAMNVKGVFSAGSYVVPTERTRLTPGARQRLWAELQPSKLQAAGVLLQSNASGGHYREVYIPLGDQTYFCARPKGEQAPWPAEQSVHGLMTFFGERYEFWIRRNTLPNIFAQYATGEHLRGMVMGRIHDMNMMLYNVIDHGNDMSFLVGALPDTKEWIRKSFTEDTQSSGGILNGVLTQLTEDDRRAGERPARHLPDRSIGEVDPITRDGVVIHVDTSAASHLLDRAAPTQKPRPNGSGMVSTD